MSDGSAGDPARVRAGPPDGGDHDGGAAPAVLVVDPDPLTVRAVWDAIRLDGRLRCVGQAGDGAAATALAAELRPELVALEPRAAGVRDDVGLIARLLDAGGERCRVVVFASDPDPALQIVALRQGAVGVVEKGDGIPALLDALVRVAAGEVVVSGALAMRVIELLRQAPEGSSGLRPVRSTLTNREWEVLDLLATGRSTRQVAEALVLTEDTIYSHVKSLMRKLDVHTRSAAIGAAERLRARPDS